MAKKKTSETADDVSAKSSRKPIIPLTTVVDVLNTIRKSCVEIEATCKALATHGTGDVSWDGAGSLYKAMELLAGFEGELESLKTRTERLKQFASSLTKP